MLRFLGVLFSLIGFLIGHLPVMPYVEGLKKKDPDRARRYAKKAVDRGFSFILRVAGAKIEVRGKENIPQDQAVLFIGNHRSYFDILISSTNIEQPCGFLSKIEMKKIPLLSKWMEYIDCLFLDRDNVREGLKTIQAAIENINNGISVFVFPEGTRGKSESELELAEFHEGSFRIATKTDCPIVPVAISHSADLFEKHTPFIRKTRIILEFCPPIDPSGLSREEKKSLGKMTRGIILETLTRNETI